MFGFILFGVGLRALATQHAGATQRSAPTQGSARAAGALAWLGGSLGLPYYRAEAFGLHVIGARAVADQDVSLVSLVDVFRSGVIPMTLFGAGLLLAVAVRRAAGKPPEPRVTRQSVPDTPQFCAHN